MKIELLNKKTNKLEIIKDDLIMESLYFLNYKLPISTSKIKTQEVKDYISQLESKIPLYDIYTSNIYLITPTNLYYRITYNHYRFPNQTLLNKLGEEIDELKKNKKIKKDIMIERKIKKYNLMKEFMANFNLNILEDTFYRTMYKYSPELGRNLLFCKRPSFNKYIHNSKPYYNRIEIINLARNMDMDIDITKITSKRLEELCDIIRKNDISKEILLEHQKHIVSNNLLGLIQYYTIQGSANINSYLRNSNFSAVANNIYNNIIGTLWNLCYTSPPFDNDYILYRFIKDDLYLQNLKIGEIYTDNSFMSTTRDPFYRSDTYNFGFILIKVKIPKNIKGVGLCLEGCSHFPEEQEIIFAPGTKYKLTAKNENITYYHTDLNFSSKIKTKYEFTWISSADPSEYCDDKNNLIYNPLEKKSKFNKSEDNPKTINFLDLISNRTNGLTEKIKIFTTEYLSETSQFITKIGKHNIIVIAEKYNSSGAYKKFYAITIENGFCFYSFYNNYILFLINIGTVNNIDMMHVNYYVKYNTLDKENIVSQDAIINFISSIAYYFNIDKVIIYSEYKPCSMFSGKSVQRIGKDNSGDSNIIDVENIENINELIGNYCVDFYEYLKTNKKRYANEKILNIELTPKFSYYDLEYLKYEPTENFFDKTDDELYQLYQKSYKIDNPNSKLADYLIWIIENKCYLIDKFINKLNILYKINPFKRDMYILNPKTYLYNRGMITAYDDLYDFEIEEREPIINITDEYKRINNLTRDYFE